MCIHTIGRQPFKRLSLLLMSSKNASGLHMTHTTSFVHLVFSNRMATATNEGIHWYKSGYGVKLYIYIYLIPKLLMFVNPRTRLHRLRMNSLLASVWTFSNHDHCCGTSAPGLWSYQIEQREASPPLLSMSHRHWCRTSAPVQLSVSQTRTNKRLLARFKATNRYEILRISVYSLEVVKDQLIKSSVFLFSRTNFGTMHPQEWEQIQRIKNVQLA